MGKVEDRQKELMELFKAKYEKTGGNVKLSCIAVGISRQTYYNWIKQNPEWEQLLKHEKEGAKDNVESALYKAALGGNVTAMIYFLNWNARDRGYNLPLFTPSDQITPTKFVFKEINKDNFKKW